jgi:hypothetical protein
MTALPIGIAANTQAIETSPSIAATWLRPFQAKVVPRQTSIPSTATTIRSTKAKSRCRARLGKSRGRISMATWPPATSASGAPVKVSQIIAN